MAQNISQVISQAGELLAAEPARAIWRQLTGLLLHLPPGAPLDEFLERADRELERWPDELRTLTPALGRRLKAPFPRVLRLVRRLDTVRHAHELRATADLMRFFSELRFARLSFFRVRYCGFGDRGAQCIAEQDLQLQDLILGNCAIGDAGALSIAASPRMRTLRSLSLYSNEVTAKGARALLDSPHLRGLQRLNLYDNRLGTDAATEFESELHSRGC